VHTLSFDESSEWQRRWALYTAAWCGRAITERLRRTGPLRVDWLDPALTAPGRLGITLLPGRRDHGRQLDRDLGAIGAEGITDVLALLTSDELAAFGVPDLFDRYAAAGLAVRHLPIVDQRTSSLAEMRQTVAWMRPVLAAGGRLLLHCVGGLGRSGLAAACLLVAAGRTADEALAEVRRARGPRAVESALQERFVRDFGP
jgi:protein-tyrosine phosphatase